MSINQHEQKLVGVKAFIAKTKKDLRKCTDAREEAYLKRLLRKLEEKHIELAGGLKE